MQNSADKLLGGKTLMNHRSTVESNSYPSSDRNEDRTPPSLGADVGDDDEGGGLNGTRMRQRWGGELGRMRRERSH